MGVLRKIFGPKIDGLTGEWRKLYNKELCDIYSLPNFIRGDQTKRMKWQGMWLVWFLEEMHTEFHWGKMMGREHWEYLGVDG